MHRGMILYRQIKLNCCAHDIILLRVSLKFFYVINGENIVIAMSGFEMFYCISVACDLGFIFVCANKNIRDLKC